MAEDLAIEEVRPTIDQILQAIPSTSEKGQSCEPMQCGMCQKQFQNRSAKAFHMRKTHRISVYQNVLSTWEALEKQFGAGKARARNSKDPRTASKFFCPLDKCASKSYASAKLLVQHFQKTHQEKRHQCPNCTARFSLLRDLTYHAKKTCPKAKALNRDQTEITAMSVKADKRIKIGRISKETQTEIGILDRRTKVWLIPFMMTPIVKYKKILPRPTNPEPAQICPLPELSGNTTEVGLQANFPPLGNSAQNECYNGFSEAAEMVQDSYSQTVYPQMVDFGTQYGDEWAQFAEELQGNDDRSDAGGLQTPTYANASVGPDYTQSMSYYDDQIAQMNACNSRHIETQTIVPSSECYCAAPENGNYCNIAENSTEFACVETQTLPQVPWTLPPLSTWGFERQMPLQQRTMTDFSTMTDMTHH
ncbi:ATM interactor [Ditylenchus destructor]|uniref:ATM interactor n=1 Tax=Ditylenchus destructor TaxID=166010 RepID=A0AAD4R0H3_9BILA|nr:ATM interactor [Ditylenchus destructor]